MSITTEHVDQVVGRPVTGPDGEKLGDVRQVYLDDETGRPEWVTVRTGLFGGKESFVPLGDATLGADGLQVPYTKDVVKDAPRVDADGHLSKSEEADLYQHYGLVYDQPGGEVSGQKARSGNATGAGHDTSGPETDDAMTRSEEQLRVGTEQHETGRARLRKHIVTEQKTVTVPVQREEVRVEREPITDANRDAALSGGDLTEEEHEVTLHEERPVVEKEVVPVERVKLAKDTTTNQVEVNEDLRQERIDADGVDETR